MAVYTGTAQIDIEFCIARLIEHSYDTGIVASVVAFVFLDEGQSEFEPLCEHDHLVDYRRGYRITVNDGGADDGVAAVHGN